MLIVSGLRPPLATASYVDELMLATVEGADATETGQAVETVEPASAGIYSYRFH